tara:strand:+ start:13047 stop:13466 length:420 start_codon:yes stop_codon:yes gene_type:complete
MGCGCNKNKKPATSNKTYSSLVNSKLGYEAVPPQINAGKPFPHTKENQEREKAEKEKNKQQKSPSLFTKALNLGEALANHVADGMSKVTKDQMAARLGICERCPFRSEGTCTKCGCVLSVKAGWKTSDCPDNRWPKIAN